MWNFYLWIRERPNNTGVFRKGCSMPNHLWMHLMYCMAVALALALFCFLLILKHMEEWQWRKSPKKKPLFCSKKCIQTYIDTNNLHRYVSLCNWHAFSYAIFYTRSLTNFLLCNFIQAHHTSTETYQNHVNDASQISSQILNENFRNKQENSSLHMNIIYSYAQTKWSVTVV